MLERKHNFEILKVKYSSAVVECKLIPGLNRQLVY